MVVCLGSILCRLNKADAWNLQRKAGNESVCNHDGFWSDFYRNCLRNKGVQAQDAAEPALYQ